MYIYVKESVSKLKTKGYAKELFAGTSELENGFTINTHWYSDDCLLEILNQYIVFFYVNHTERMVRVRQNSIRLQPSPIGI